ncbi:hypothetical protein DFJ77DRAFT_178540 [Powellomyces hirtus]|nr:hypothetical protein DFJ77DRAFT_178540 [Powellomyces hirtus]
MPKGPQNDPMAAISNLRDKTHDLFHSLKLAKRAHTFDLPVDPNALNPPPPPLPPHRSPERHQTHGVAETPTSTTHTQTRRTRTRIHIASCKPATTTVRPISPTSLTLPRTRPPLHSPPPALRTSSKHPRRSPSPQQVREALATRAHRAHRVLNHSDEWFERIDDFRRTFPAWFRAENVHATLSYNSEAVRAAATEDHQPVVHSQPNQEDETVLEDAQYHYGGVFRVNDRLFPAHVLPVVTFAGSDNRAGFRWELGLDERPVKVSVPDAVIADIPVTPSRPIRATDPVEADNLFDITKVYKARETTRQQALAIYLNNYNY